MTTTDKPRKFREVDWIRCQMERVHYSDMKARIQMSWIEAERWCSGEYAITSELYPLKSIIYSHSVIGSDGIQYHWGIGTYLKTGRQVYLLVAIDFK